MSTTATTVPAPRPVYWTVRRELWENRSIYLAPAIVGGLEILGILISAIRHHEMVQIQMEGDFDGAKAQLAMSAVYGALGIPILVTSLIVAAFYCLDALYSERRDRSILFWKSLPVSDSLTVLSKALIPFLVLPAITLAVICATQIVALVASWAALRMSGIDTTILGAVPVWTMPILLAYSLLAMSLWYAPLYGWLFLVSAFARRKTILWALLPPAGICIIEKLAFDSDYFSRLLAERFLGFVKVAFLVGSSPENSSLSLDKLTPGILASAPGLWIGLAVAAAFFAGAIQLRRYRGPV